MSDESPYLKHSSRLADIITAIQVMGSYQRCASRSIEKREVELGNFSGEDGFCSMEFFIPENDDEIEILVDLNIGVNSAGENNIFQLLSAKLRGDFGLVECL